MSVQVSFGGAADDDCWRLGAVRNAAMSVQVGAHSLHRATSREAAASGRRTGGRAPGQGLAGREASSAPPSAGPRCAGHKFEPRASYPPTHLVRRTRPNCPAYRTFHSRELVVPPRTPRLLRQFTARWVVTAAPEVRGRRGQRTWRQARRLAPPRSASFPPARLPGWVRTGRRSSPASRYARHPRQRIRSPASPAAATSGQPHRHVRLAQGTASRPSCDGLSDERSGCTSPCCSQR